MALRLGSIVLGASDIEESIDFWSEAMGYRIHRWEGEDNFVILIPPSEDGIRIAIQTTDTPAQDHSRVHLDLITDSAAEQRAEVDRLVGLGATKANWDLYPEDPDFVVMTDPSGNHFCVIDASH